MEKIRIKYKEGVAPLKKITQGDWIDLSTSKEYIFDFDDDITYIDLGVAMELPEGYEAIIAPRSSTFKKWGIIQVNSIGIIDNSYSGDNDWWKMPVIADHNVIIPEGTRIAQFRIQKKQPEIIFTTVESLNNKDRGGFGSTGD